MRRGQSDGSPLGRLRGPRRERSLRRDERGNLLLIAGVLLIVGFTALASSLVHMGTLEETTLRVQEQRLVVPIEGHMAELDAQFVESRAGLEQNRTRLQVVMRSAEAHLIHEAARAGLYVSLVPTTDDPSLWRQPERCLGYDPAATGDGLVVGWSVDDLEETIAGVAYSVEATDGSRRMSFLHYVTLEQCTFAAITTTPAAHTASLGSASQSGTEYTLVEVVDPDTLVTVWLEAPIIAESIVSDYWEDEDRIVAQDGDNAELASSWAALGGNRLFFRVQPPAGLPDETRLENVMANVTAHLRNGGSSWNVLLEVFYPAGDPSPLMSKPIPVTTAAETHSLALPMGPSGAGWTRDELGNTRWQLRVEGPHESNQELRVDHFMLEGSIETSGYRLDVEFEWDSIPVAYTEHALHLRYHVPDEGTPDEAFLLQVRDAAGALGWETLEEMRHTAAPQEVQRAVTEYLHVEEAVWAEPVFRVVDAFPADDQVPDDEDTLRIDHLYLVSEIPS